MKNPWLGLGPGDTVFDGDRGALKVFNQIREESLARDVYLVDTDLLPEPFFGPLNANVVVLLSNPGLSPDDKDLHIGKTPNARRFQKELRESLKRSKGPHFHLTYEGDSPGKKWWIDRTRELIEACEAIENPQLHVARNLLAIEYFPYHSIKYDHTSVRLPSQDFAFYLVRAAIERNAVIVLARSDAEWFGAVPELYGYERLVRTKSRAVHLSSNNLDRFDLVRRGLGLS